MRLRRLLPLLCAPLLTCDGNRSEVAGGSSEQGNALGAVRFVVLDRYGHPADAEVSTLPGGWLAGMDSTEGRRFALGAGETARLDSLRDSVCILAQGTAGQRVACLSPGAFDTLQLEPPASLQGHGEPGETVQVPGTRLTSRCDALGNFRFDSLPVGTPSLSFPGRLRQVLQPLHPATRVWLAPSNDLGGIAAAQVDSVRLAPPQTLPTPGTYEAQVTVATWHPLREALFEQAPAPDGPWTPLPAALVLNRTTSLWLRARLEGSYASTPQRFTWTILPALQVDSLLPLVDARPAGLLYAFLPDSVVRRSGAVHVYALIQGCSDLSGQGMRGWIHGDSLGLFRLPCTQGQQTLFHLVVPDRDTLRWAHTLQPRGMTFPLSPPEATP